MCGERQRANTRVCCYPRWDKVQAQTWSHYVGGQPYHKNLLATLTSINWWHVLVTSSLEVAMMRSYHRKKKEQKIAPLIHWPMFGLSLHNKYYGYHTIHLLLLHNKFPKSISSLFCNALNVLRYSFTHWWRVSWLWARTVINCLLTSFVRQINKHKSCSVSHWSGHLA